MIAQIAILVKIDALKTLILLVFLKKTGARINFLAPKETALSLPLYNSS
jgi:hypothetical protein